jgi:tripartite-type tricarboxylate transporter receptor subunit TctC
MARNSGQLAQPATLKPHPVMGEVASLGLADHAITIWWGLIAPNGVPADRMARLNDAFLTAARTPRFRELVESQGATYALRVGSEMGDATRAEYEALGAVARELGLARPAR